MRRWTTPEQVMADLRLKAAPLDLKAMETEILARLLDLHPDRHGGKFPSKEAEEEYLETASALAFVRDASKALVPIEVATSLARELGREIIGGLMRPTESVEEKIVKTSAIRQASVTGKLRLPRISLAAITAAITFVFLFPQQFSAHPYLEPVLAHPRASLIWFTVTVLIGELWLIAWLFESRSKERIARLFGFDYQQYVLSRLRQYGTQFSRGLLRRALIYYLDSYHRKLGHAPDGFEGHAPDDLEGPPFVRPPYASSWWFPQRRFLGFVEPDAIDEATDMALTRYLDREWVIRVRKQDLDEWFEIRSE